MKIRIKGNFIRYRLTKTEVQLLADKGYVEEETHFAPGKKLIYSLEVKQNINSLQVEFTNNKISMFIPVIDAKQWNDIPKVGYRNTITVDKDNILVLLLEKDFQCLDETLEDQSDNFSNPLANQAP